MAVLQIIEGETPELRVPCENVDPAGDMISELIVNLMETMHAHHMASLSAVQCGIPVRLFVTEVLGDTQVWINPVILLEEGNATSAESCASFPELVLKISRPEKLLVQVISMNGEIEERVVTGIAAKLVCHELDHLDGVLYQDHLDEEDLFAQILGVAHGEEMNDSFLEGLVAAFNTPEGIPDNDGDDSRQILDLMADGTWKWVLALELLKDIQLPETEQAVLRELENLLQKLGEAAEYWEQILTPLPETPEGEE